MFNSGNSLYEPGFEHDNCGIGAVVNIKGKKSHKTVEDALTIVETLEHRAGKDADGKTGDGVGILVQISHTFFKKAAAEIGIELSSERDYAVGMFFFPQRELQRNQAKKMFEIIVKKQGFAFLGWRDVVALRARTDEVAAIKADGTIVEGSTGFTVEGDLSGNIGTAGQDHVATKVNFTVTANGAANGDQLFFKTTVKDENGAIYNLDSETQLYDTRGYHYFMVNDPLN